MRRQEDLSVTDCVKIGVGTGVVLTGVNLPLWTIKNRALCDLPFTLAPLVLYRGLFMAVFFTSAIYVTQVLNSNIARRLMESDVNTKEQLNRYRIAGAFGGGAASALLFGPLDLLITQQHKHNRPKFFPSAIHTYDQIGLRGIFKGTPLTFFTDATFTGLYYGIFPILKRSILSFIDNEMFASIAAGLGTGLAATAATQIPEVIKTRQQHEVDEKFKTARECAKEFYYRKNGIGFFKAFIPRTICSTAYVGFSGIVADQVETAIRRKKHL